MVKYMQQQLQQQQHLYLNQIVFWLSTKFFAWSYQPSIFNHLRTIVIYGPSHKTLGRRFDRIEMNIESIESKKHKMPLLKELSRTSQDSFQSESDSKESRDVRLDSFRSGIFHFCHFWANSADRPRILSNQIPIRKNPGTIGLLH